MAKQRTQPLLKTRPARKQERPMRKTSPSHHLMTIPRDHIIPFRANVFGLTRRDEPDSHVTVFDPDRRPDIGDKVVILWADKTCRPEFGYYASSLLSMEPDARNHGRFASNARGS